MSTLKLSTEFWSTRVFSWLFLGFVLLAIGIGLAVVPLTVAGILLLGLLTLAVTAVRLRWGLYFLILAIPFGSFLEVRLGVLSIGAAEAIAVGVVLIWFGDMAVRRRIQVPSTPLLLPLAAFLGIIALSLFSAISLEQSLKGALLWLEFALIYFVVVAKVERQGIKGLVLATFAAGVGQALLGGYQFFSGEGPESFQVLGRFTRAYGTFGQPNPFGGYLGLIFALALGATLGQGLGKERGFLYCVLLGVTAALLAGGIVLSWSRGTWLAALGGVAIIALFGIFSRSFSPLTVALLVGVVLGGTGFLWAGPTAETMAIGLVVGIGTVLGGGVLFYFALRSRWMIILVGTVLFAAAMLWGLGGGQLIPGGVEERFLDFIPYLENGDVRFVPVNDENYAVLERLALWQAAGEMVREHPWLGVGIGNYVAAYPNYALPGWKDPLGHAHNYYLHIAAETGIPGLLAYLGLWIAAFAQGMRLLFRGSPEWKGLVLGILGMMAALSLHNLVDNLYVQGMNLQVAIFLAVLTVLEKEELFKSGEV